MYIVIFGKGGMEYTLSKTLLGEGHEVLVLEGNANVCECIVDELGSICIQGDGCDVDSLAEAGTERADMFIAITNEDEDNLVACQLAKHRFNVPRTIACVNDTQNERIFTQLGIDVAINITELVAAHIYQEIATHPLVRLLSLPEEEMEIVEIKVLPASSVVGRHIGDIELPEGTVLSLIMREGEAPFAPMGDTIINADDRLIASLKVDNEEKLITLLAGR